jgi:hypothetical protein
MGNFVGFLKIIFISHFLQLEKFKIDLPKSLDVDGAQYRRKLITKGKILKALS